MKIYLKICENENCGEIMGAFPRKKCQFCGSEKFSTHHILMGLVLGESTKYSHINRDMGIIKNYLGVDHLIIRTKKGETEGNACDNNGGYIHIIDIDDTDEVETFIKSRISKYGEYI